MPDSDAPSPKRNFIQEIIDADLRNGKWGRRVHAVSARAERLSAHRSRKSICLNFGLAEEYGGACNLRFDDTNPIKEEQEFVDAIVEDVRWLGFRWPEAREDDALAGVLFASDYFEKLYEWAVELIKKGKAYVDDQSAEQIRTNRGTLTTPGSDSAFRKRGVDENVDLFARMRAGEFPDGSKVLRAKIDMTSPNMNLRDPVMYRVLHAEHHRAGAGWCVYPMYDWAHGLEDSIEGITHSICTLEFENHRPLYDWFIDALNEGRSEDGSGPWGAPLAHPQQIEFARLNLSHTVVSKRKLRELVEEKHVRGWDDPRMPTLGALRRRGYTPEAIREFCIRVGVAKFDGVSELALLEHCVRQHLNRVSPRVMAVLRPLRVVIENYPEQQSERLDAINNPEDESAGTRKIPFSRVLYIERDDFMLEPPRKFFRLAPGREVRLRYAYFITCREAIRDDAGKVIELRCTYDPATRGGDAPDGRKVKGTLHWVSAAEALKCDVRLYDTLFSTADPESTESGSGGSDWTMNLNPDSLEEIEAFIEPSLAAAEAGARYQFERLGYFCVDPDSTRERLVFNRTVSLKDRWSKRVKR